MTTEDDIRQELGKYLEPEAHEDWLDAHHEVLGCTPREAIDEGRADEVLAMIIAYGDGAYL